MEKSYFFVLGLAVLLCGGLELRGAPLDENAKPPADPPTKMPAAPPPARLVTVPYIGVRVVSIESASSAELGLSEGVGLKVTHVDPRSAAAHRLHFADVLYRLEDQILINARQFDVLIRTCKPGAEILVRLFRGGVPMTVTLVVGDKKLSEAELHSMRSGGIRIQTMRGGGGADGNIVLDPEMLGIRGGMATEIHFGAAGMQTIKTIREGGRAYALKKTTKEIRTLRVTDEAGTVLFDGPVNTAEERKKLPAEIRAGLAQFDLDDGGEVKGVIRIQPPGDLAKP